VRALRHDDDRSNSAISAGFGSGLRWRRASPASIASCLPASPSRRKCHRCWPAPRPGRTTQPAGREGPLLRSRAGWEARIVTVADPDAPELFCLITDLHDRTAYPAGQLAQAYHWRWIGSETCLREAKSAISGAGPSTGPMLRSGSPPPDPPGARHLGDRCRAGPRCRPRRRGGCHPGPQGPPRRPAGAPRQISFTAARRAVIASSRSGAATASLSAALTRGQPGRHPGWPGQAPRPGRPLPQDQGPAGLPAGRAAPGHPHHAGPDQRLPAPDRLTPGRLHVMLDGPALFRAGIGAGLCLSVRPHEAYLTDGERCTQRPQHDRCMSCAIQPDAASRAGQALWQPCCS
jgi:hypothetical protein